MRLGSIGRHRICLFCILLTFVPFASALHAQTSVWIDADPGLGMLLKDSDDAIAIAYALKSSRLRVEGISVSFGNSYMPKSQKVAQDVVNKFAANPKAVGVYPGAINKQYSGLATEATTGLQSALEKRKLIYIALGPLTNLATLLQTRPNLAAKIDQVVWVAGRKQGSTLTLGSTNPFSFSDSNLEKDPRSAQIVFESKIPITLVSRELSPDFLLTRSDQKAIAESGPSGKWLASEMDHWMTLFKTAWNTEGAPMPDALAAVVVSYPSSVQTEARFAGFSMDLKNLVGPKEGQSPKYLFAAAKSATGLSRPVTYVTKVEGSAKENWLKVMSEKSAK